MTKTKYHILENKKSLFLFFDIEYVLVDYPSNPVILWMPPYEALTVGGGECGGCGGCGKLGRGVRMWRVWCG